ncbi:MAG: hypothetical protein P1V20_28495, partial [Verrucomicrobiales bacterium]|nr:hypothetical protein [Verrucomicrobiales bacterium]
MKILRKNYLNYSDTLSPSEAPHEFGEVRQASLMADYAGKFVSQTHQPGSFWHFDFRDAFLTRLQARSAGFHLESGLGHILKVFWEPYKEF